MDGRDFACASDATNASRSGYWALMIELCTTEEKSFATCLTTPNISPRLPAFWSSCACSCVSFFSLASNAAARFAPRWRCVFRVAFTCASISACFARSARNFFSRSSFSCASRWRARRVCSSSSSRLPGVAARALVPENAADRARARGIHRPIRGRIRVRSFITSPLVRR
jgi:hypothetical protein